MAAGAEHEEGADEALQRTGLCTAAGRCISPLENCRRIPLRRADRKTRAEGPIARHTECDARQGTPHYY